MRFALSEDSAVKVGTLVAPMMGLALQLLMFFLAVYSVGASARPAASIGPIVPVRGREAAVVSVIHVGLHADAHGDLAEILVNGQRLRGDDAALDRLSVEVGRLVTRRGHPLANDVEVEIDADYELRYEHVLRVVAACTGRVDPQTNELVRYIERVKFAPPHRPKGE